MKRTTIALIAVVLLAGLAGCVGGDNSPDKEQNTEATTNGTIVYDGVETSDEVTRFVEAEAGVVCYYFAYPAIEAGQGGISCLPINDTALEGSDL